MWIANPVQRVVNGSTGVCCSQPFAAALFDGCTNPEPAPFTVWLFNAPMLASGISPFRWLQNIRP